eukprot:g23495.t1
MCTYHTQHSRPSKGQSAGRMPKVQIPSTKVEARQQLDAAMTSLSQLTIQLEDAILAAFDAGVEEDDLLPAFSRAQREKRLDELFTELDSSGDGVLEAAEVKILLQGLADGKEPAEEELTFIMRTIGHKNKEKITRAQLTQAIESWTLYLQEFGSDDSAGKAPFQKNTSVKVLFEKYDKSKTGKLDHEELKSLLIDLAGRDVSQEDVDWIMAKADVLGDGMIAKIELSQADALLLLLVSCFEDNNQFQLASVCDPVSIRRFLIDFQAALAKVDVRPPITMNFEVPQFTASGLRVRFLKVQEKSQYKPVKWIRYLTKAGTYEHRI